MAAEKMVFPPWDVIWHDFCPQDSTNQNGTKTFSECQQHLVHIPLYLLIAVFSAYHFGRQSFLVVRDKTQIIAIYFRTYITLALAALPVIRCYIYLLDYDQMWPIDVLVSCFEVIAWIVHFGYLLSYRSHGPLTSRGPLMLIVLWLLAFVLSVAWLDTGLHHSHLTLRIVAVVLHCFYGLTLFPKGRSVLINRRNREQEERQALLGNRYVRFYDQPDDNILGTAQESASLFSKMFFCWVNPLIKNAIEDRLNTINDLFALPETLSIKNITEHFQRSIDRTRSLFFALHRSFGKEFYLVGLIRLIADLSGFAGPLLLGALLKYEQSSDTESESTAILTALGLFLSSLIAAFCSVHFNWRISLVTIKMKIGLVTAIYRKSLEARGLKSARPEVLNLMSTDTDRVVNSCVSFHSLWSIPFQLFTTLVLLYYQVGAAFLAGLVFAIILIPINRYIATWIGRLSSSLMTEKDKRVMLTSEALSGAKQIKLNAWEDIFTTKINKLRDEEIKYLSKRKYLDALCVYFWATTPVLMCLLTFGVAALTHNVLTPATTYTSVALLNMLIGPLNAFPWVLNGLTEAWVSLKRIQELIDLPNIDLSMYYSPVENRKSSKTEKPIVLTVSDATFEFENKREREDEDENPLENVEDFRLEGVNIEVKKGELVCIDGPVGSGKSSFLSALLADLTKVDGAISIQDANSGFGYVSQTVWLQRGSIRDNIIWGSNYDEQRYRATIFACCLTVDLNQLGGDTVFVGEGGKTLSGGQQMRVSLARAVYQNKSIYLLDDILSSLDTHVAFHIIHHCILGLLATKTRIIVTDNKKLLSAADQIFRLNNGQLTITNCVADDSSEDGDEYITQNEKPKIIKKAETVPKKSEEELENVVYHEETRQVGNLKPGTVFEYWKAVSGKLSIAVLLSVVLMQASRNASDLWLAHWVGNANTNTPSNSTNNEEYLGIYSAIVISNSFLTFARAFLFAYAGIKAAKILHQRLLNRVFSTKMSFFDITPLGRILNRFSSDTYTIDDSLPFILNILLAQVFGLGGALLTTLYALPWLAIVIIPMVPIYVNVQNKYRNASREIKRLASNSLSPLYSHFTETLEGLSTIRAMRGSSRFHRDFLAKLEESVRAQVTATASQQWLALRLQLLGSVLIGGCGVIAVTTAAHISNPSLVGMAISYALSITSLLSGVLNAIAETEQELVAVERVNEYCNLEPEQNANGAVEAPYGWPVHGVVKLENVCLKYGDSSKWALTNVAFETEPYEKIGIVGRTGAGKTSIVAALFRVEPIWLGKLSIDHVDISTLSLNTLRNRIALVPQDPFLFRGTIRQNLDPRNNYYESEIWNAITKCLASPLVQSLGGLSGMIESKGSNLSLGQKQLLCLTRAFLKNSKVICIDEGTAHLDIDSEAVIHNVLRTAFRSSTVIHIAHRMYEINNMDRVFVMENGFIIESGEPRELEVKPGSHYSGMALDQ